MNYNYMLLNDKPAPPRLRNNRSGRLLILTSLLLLASVWLTYVTIEQLLHLSSSRRQDAKHRKPDNSTIQGDIGLISSHNQTRWLISHSKCHIPVLDAMEPAVASQFFVDLKPLDCPKMLAENGTLSKPLTFVKDNRLYFNHQYIPLTMPPITCCMRDITRLDNDDKEIEVDPAKCTPILQDGLEAPGSLIKVECQPGNYTNFHFFMKHDLEEEAAMERVADRKLNRDDHYNVLILGLDTVSRLNGVRRLVKTRKVLETHYNAMEFFGYNKVGENTFPNLVPLLTGMTPAQLVETDCWPSKNYQVDHDGADDPFDNCKFLWNYFQEMGYLTYYHEDWPIASTFNYLKDGFRNAPTLHYGRPFTLARDSYGMPYSHMGCKKCHYDEPLHRIDLESFKNFIDEYEGSPQFAFHWINCPQHDDLDGGMLIDEDVAQFLLDIKETTHDSNTFVLVLSDHGYRWGDFLKTRLGHYETSLPMLFIAPPKMFRERHQRELENMKLHQNVLLTPFDLFKSMLHLLNMGKLHANATNRPDLDHPAAKQLELSKIFEFQRQQLMQTTSQAPLPAPHVTQLPEDPSTMGPFASTIISQLESIDGSKYNQSFKTLSIFDQHEPAELDRSCIEAGIPDNYCVCQDFQTIDAAESDPVVLGAAYYFVYVHLYEILNDNLNLCHELDLKHIEMAQLYQFSAKQIIEDKRRRRRRRKRSSVGGRVNVGTSPSARITTSQPSINQTKYELVSEARLPPTRPPPKTTTTSLKPASSSTSALANSEILITNLPAREYNIRLSTTPGDALFQEVVRYYGPQDLIKCKQAVASIKDSVSSSDHHRLSYQQKHNKVAQMNEQCKFRVYSDSTSRLNLYRDQSQCITQHNVELKKTCLCRDLDSQSKP